MLTDRLDKQVLNSDKSMIFDMDSNFLRVDRGETEAQRWLRRVQEELATDVPLTMEEIDQIIHERG